jgi:hypothetical protein
MSETYGDYSNSGHTPLSTTSSNPFAPRSGTPNLRETSPTPRSARRSGTRHYVAAPSPHLSIRPMTTSPVLRALPWQ